MKTLQHYNESFYSVVVEPTRLSCTKEDFSGKNCSIGQQNLSNTLKCLWQRDPFTKQISCQWVAI